MKKLNIKFSSLGIGLILTLIFVLLLVFEVYVVYNNLYSKLAAESESIDDSSIVRVDLDAYQKTIDLLDELDTYVPPSLLLNRFNPFQ